MQLQFTFAKELRQNQTNVESNLWYHLRAKRFLGLKFRRQQPIGKYIVDFVNHERKVIVEIDGGQHADEGHENSDEERDVWLKQEGYEVLRFWNNQITSNLNGVLEMLKLHLERHPSLHH